MRGRRWTKEEDEYLRTHWGVHSRKACAKHLGKSVNAVRNHAVLIGLGCFKDSCEKMRFSDLPEILGVARQNLYKVWVQKNGLKVKKIGEYLYIDERDLFTFMKEHPHLYDARKCDPYFFGNEKWFQERLAQDRKDNCKTRWKRPWTKAEENRLLWLKRQGKTNSEIAKELDRTKSCVAKRYQVLTNPLKYKDYRRWTDEDIEKLKMLVNTDESVEDIAWQMDRTESAIKMKIARMGLRNG